MLPAFITVAVLLNHPYSKEIGDSLCLYTQKHTDFGEGGYVATQFKLAVEYIMSVNLLELREELKLS